MFLPLRSLWIHAHRWVGVMLAPVFLVVVLSGAALSFAPQTHAEAWNSAGSSALTFMIALALLGVTTTGVWSWGRDRKPKAGDTAILGAQTDPSGADRLAPEAEPTQRFRLVGRRRLDEPAQDVPAETWSVALESEDDVEFRPGDLLHISPWDGGPERAYLIGSSSLVDPRLVVLTLRLHRFVNASGGLAYGRASGELVRDTPLGGLVLGQIHPQLEFRPPADPMQPIVMIAAGAGVGPFPGFLDERDASGWAGPAWLIFGNRHRGSDFLWDERFQAALRDGSLTRLDTAFSRDVDDGAYVQDRLLEQRQELRRWLIEDGAMVYISGRREVARDVEATIAAILAEAASPVIAEDRIRVDAFD